MAYLLDTSICVFFLRGKFNLDEKIKDSLTLKMIMEDVTLKLDEQGQGAFVIIEGDEQLGEMVIEINDKDLTVYHTEVSPKAEGRGYAKKLMEAMVDYARGHQLKVIPLCPYVHAQFKRHPELYEDVWKKQKL